MGEGLHLISPSFLSNVRPTKLPKVPLRLQTGPNCSDCSRNKPNQGWRTKRGPSLWVMVAQEVKSPQLNSGHLTHLFNFLLPEFLGYRKWP